MRAVVQRVSEARVVVGEEEVGAIGPGLLLLLAVERGDGPAQGQRMARKVAGLRIFADAAGKMNLPVGEVGGAVLVVSQFTLAADLRKGFRPSFDNAAPPAEAEALYAGFCEELERTGIPVARGRFAAHMAVHLVNDGPVTLWLEFPPEG